MIQFDRVNSLAGSVDPDTITLSCAGNNRILLVGVQVRDTAPAQPSVNAMTCNGSAMTKILGISHTVTIDVRSELWYFVAPTEGLNTISVDWTVNPTRATIGAISFTGVDQLNPIEANNSAEGTSTTPSVAVTTVTNDAFVVASIGVRVVGAFTPGANEIEKWDLSAGTSQQGAGYYEGPTYPAGAVTISPTCASGAWVAVGAALKPASSASFKQNVLRPHPFSPGLAR